LKIILHHRFINFIYLLLLTLGLLNSISFGQVRDPETDELVTLKYDEKTGKYYLFGLDKMDLINGKSFLGKFIEASDSLVFFKTEFDGGQILEQEITSIEKLILKRGKQIVNDKIIDKNYITVIKQPKVQKKTKMEKFISIIKLLKFF